MASATYGYPPSYHHSFPHQDVMQSPIDSSFAQYQASMQASFAQMDASFARLGASFSHLEVELQGSSAAIGASFVNLQRMAQSCSEVLSSTKGVSDQLAPSLKQIMGTTQSREDHISDSDDEDQHQTSQSDDAPETQPTPIADIDARLKNPKTLNRAPSMDDTLYDEFGNYIGPEIESDQDDSDRDSDNDDVELPDCSAASDDDAAAPNGWMTSAADVDMENQVVLAEDKKYYPTAEEVYDDDVETLVMDEDAMPLEQPIIQPVRNVKFEVGVKDSSTYVATEFLVWLMSNPALIRNVALVGHLQHGKTVFMDMLVEQTHRMSTFDASSDKHVRYTDTRIDEQERRISIKVVPMSLVLEDSNSKSYLCNVMDTPGHVNFSDEMTASLRLADGAVLVVDAAEGMMVNTERAIRHAIQDHLPIVVVINKVDRLTTELKLPPRDAYFKLRHTLEVINNHIAAASSTAGHVQVIDPLAGNVCFASATAGWSFTLQPFAKLYVKLHGIASSETSIEGWVDDAISTSNYSSLQDIIFRFKERKQGAELKWSEFPTKVAVQMNDTHPTLAISEFMRSLLDVKGLGGDEAWDVTSRTVAYTNHTVLPEALEKWSHKVMWKLLPRHMEIIQEIGKRFIEMVHATRKDLESKIPTMCVLDNNPKKLVVRMANLCVVSAHTVNGVAELHSDVLKAEKDKFGIFDILSDNEVREGLKKLSNWPTFPQLYCKGELLGGCDIAISNAKRIVKLVNDVGAVVNTDPEVNSYLKVIFVPIYNVSVAELLIPGSEPSQHISTAGMEASGTSNMKFSLHGCLIIGTLDGANVEIREEVGEENFFLFGATADQVPKLRKDRENGPFKPDPRFEEAKKYIRSGAFGSYDYNPLLDSWEGNSGFGRADYILVGHDFAAYLDALARYYELFFNEELKF